MPCGHGPAGAKYGMPSSAATAIPEPPDALPERYAGQPADDVLAAMIRREFPGRIAVVSSFGIEAAVLLHRVAAIDPSVPAILLDTRKLFGETLRYRDALVRRLGLKDVRTVFPDPAAIAAADPAGTLWRTDPDRCCALRKVAPLSRALSGFDAWISGRKRYQGKARAGIPVLEAVDGRIKVNPLALWSAADVAAYFRRHDLPRHPLEEDGFTSIGCLPCSDRARPGEGARDGRWRGHDKTECGIHRPHAPS